jgi:hypothetical protein
MSHGIKSVTVKAEGEAVELAVTLNMRTTGGVIELSIVDAMRLARTIEAAAKTALANVGARP